MAEEIKESYVERGVRRRREEHAERERLEAAGIVPEKPAADNPPAEAVELTRRNDPAGLEKSNPQAQEMIAWVIAAMDQKTNPMPIARKLGEIRATGLKNKQLAHELHRSEAWVSKRLRLLTAPEDVQQQIESGVLSEFQFHHHRAHVEAQAGRKKRQTLRYARMPSITIEIEAARALAGILKKLALDHGLNPITLDPGPTKKELIQVLNRRAHDIFRAIK